MNSSSRAEVVVLEAHPRPYTVQLAGRGIAAWRIREDAEEAARRINRRLDIERLRAHLHHDEHPEDYDADEIEAELAKLEADDA